MQFLESSEFKKEFKKLSKKYRTLDADLLIIKTAIIAKPAGDGTKHWNILRQSTDKESVIMKMRMVCRSTNGSNFRLIYFYNGKKVEILFIEIYFKGKKKNEDRQRIKDYWNECGD